MISLNKLESLMIGRSEDCGTAEARFRDLGKRRAVAESVGNPDGSLAIILECIGLRNRDLIDDELDGSEVRSRITELDHPLPEDPSSPSQTI